ncbi:hypothetical protein ES702_02487 [subsurface metagenome]
MRGVERERMKGLRRSLRRMMKLMRQELKDFGGVPYATFEVSLHTDSAFNVKTISNTS